MAGKIEREIGDAFIPMIMTGLYTIRCSDYYTQYNSVRLGFDLMMMAGSLICAAGGICRRQPHEKDAASPHYNTAEFLHTHHFVTAAS